MLSEHQQSRLETLLSGLFDVKAKLNEKSRVFVDQIEERYNQYESNIFLSAKQLAWLEKLYTEFVGPLE